MQFLWKPWEQLNKQDLLFVFFESELIDRLFSIFPVELWLAASISSFNFPMQMAQSSSGSPRLTALRKQPF